MSQPVKDEKREERIQTEIIVDVHGTDERALRWLIYLSDTIDFPFTALCVALRITSPC